jgi:hypothetical protein
MKLYAGIAYFKLAKEMPLSPVGTQVDICHADGRESLLIGTWIAFSYDMAIEEPEWFIPVTHEEHQAIVRENFVSYLMREHNCSREKALELFEKL